MVIINDIENKTNNGKNNTVYYLICLIAFVVQNVAVILNVIAEFTYASKIGYHVRSDCMV